jgi:hypothetical protein
MTAVMLPPRPLLRARGYGGWTIIHHERGENPGLRRQFGCMRRAPFRLKPLSPFIHHPGYPVWCFSPSGNCSPSCRSCEMPGGAAKKSTHTPWSTTGPSPPPASAKAEIFASVCVRTYGGLQRGAPSPNRGAPLLRGGEQNGHPSPRQVHPLPAPCGFDQHLPHLPVTMCQVSPCISSYVLAKTNLAPSSVLPGKSALDSALQ